MIEYAFAAPPFIALLTGIFYIALTYLGQAGLETAVESAGRTMMTGQAQTTTVTNSSGGTDVGMSAVDFKNAICNGTTGKDYSGASVSFAKMLPPFLTCNHLAFNVAPVTYSQSALGLTYTQVGGTQVANTGTYITQNGGQGQNQVMMVQLVYDWPTFSGLMGLNLGNEGNGTRQLVATSVFTTEAYSCAAAQVSC